MGIRFLCPNGHKLNVKAFLAGKRGICPQCDAKFLVPHESGGQAEAVSESVLAAATEAPEAYPAEPPPPPAPTPPSPEPVAAAPDAPPDMWYVRTAAGDQFGPADTGTMTSWVAEGRVAVDSWVWRTGWPEWKTGGQAITLLNGPAPELPSTALPTAAAPANESPATDAESLPEATSASVAYRTSRRSRQERARKVTFFLGAVVLLLFAVLITVLMKNN